MKLLSRYFLTKIDNIQVKQIKDRWSIRLSTRVGKSELYNHYFIYLDNNDYFKTEKLINKIESAKVYVSTSKEIFKSKGALFKYNVKEMYLSDGKIIICN